VPGYEPAAHVQNGRTFWRGRIRWNGSSPDDSGDYPEKLTAKPLPTAIQYEGPYFPEYGHSFYGQTYILGWAEATPEYKQIFELMINGFGGSSSYLFIDDPTYWQIPQTTLDGYTLDFSGLSWRNEL
jgi:hypothetical protein